MKAYFYSYKMEVPSIVNRKPKKPIEAIIPPINLFIIQRFRTFIFFLKRLTNPDKKVHQEKAPAKTAIMPIAVLNKDISVSIKLNRANKPINKKIMVGLDNVKKKEVTKSCK